MLQPLHPLDAAGSNVTPSGEMGDEADGPEKASRPRMHASEVRAIAPELRALLRDPDSVFESALHPVTVYSTAARILAVNTVGEKNLGRSREQIVGRPLRDFVPDMHHETVERIQQALRAETELTFEDRISLPGGDRYFLSVFNPTVVEPHGDVVIVHSYDITEHKRVSLELSHQARLLDTVEQPIIATDAAGEVTYMNRAAEDLYGWSRAEAIGKHITEVSVPASGKLAAQAILDEQRAWSGDFELQKRDGTTFLAALRVAPLFAPDGTFEGMLGASNDVSETRAVERSLQRLHALEALELMAGGVAHDLNNTLMALGGNVDILSASTTRDAEREEAIHAMETALAQARRLTSQLLGFVRGHGPKQTVVRLAPLLRDVVQLASGHQPNRVLVELDVGEETLLVAGYPGQLTQVFHNLVLNALQALGDAGQVRVRSEVIHAARSLGRAVPPGRYVKVVVEDDGPGIAPELLGRVFEPYVTTKPTGHGLGLAVVHAIVTRHGGHVEVASENGRGTAFTVYLPHASPQVRVLEGTTAPTSIRGRVLVIDDNDSVRSTIDRMLSLIGFEARCVADGDAGIEACRAAHAGRRFDVILSDLIVSRGRGALETVAELSAAAGGAPVVLCTGHTDFDFERDLRPKGFVGRLTKPFTLEELRLAVTHAIVTTRGTSSAVG